MYLSYRARYSIKDGPAQTWVSCTEVPDAFTLDVAGQLLLMDAAGNEIVRHIGHQGAVVLFHVELSDASPRAAA